MIEAVAQRDILITGLPRSGTTLTCHLLNKIDDCVALHEPMIPNSLAGLGEETIIDRIKAFLELQRRQILELGTATSKAANGMVPTNPFDGGFGEAQRKEMIDGRSIEVRNVTGKDFFLFVKHPAYFTACLPFLSQSMPCFAVMRNPLAVLLSWRNTTLDISDGRIPAGELFDKDLAKKLTALPDPLDRQFYLLDYFFGRYERFLPNRTVRYEDIIASGGRALSLLHPSASTLGEALVSRNRLGVQTDPDAHAIAERLLRSDGPYWSFYTREDVEQLVA